MGRSSGHQGKNLKAQGSDSNPRDIINARRYYRHALLLLYDQVISRQGYRECIRQDAGKAIFAGDSEACSAKVESD